MSEKNEQKYRVTSPIKRGGKRYNVNDSILLTKEEAKGLHVVPFDEAAGKDSAVESSVKTSPSSGLAATQAIKIIENSELKDLKGFVIPAPEGDEDRVTVLKAWEDKQAPAQEKSTPEEKS